MKVSRTINIFIIIFIKKGKNKMQFPNEQKGDNVNTKDWDTTYKE